MAGRATRIGPRRRTVPKTGQGPLSGAGTSGPAQAVQGADGRHSDPALELLVTGVQMGRLGLVFLHQQGQLVVRRAQALHLGDKPLQFGLVVFELGLQPEVP